MPNVRVMAQEMKPGTDDRAPRRVLFVCTGNTCRSPMAAALLNHMVSEREIEPSLVAASAGLFAADGAPISPHAAKALSESGVDPTRFEGHAARTVSAEMIDEADVVVGITARHAMDLILRFPESAAKIEALPLDVDDPFGGDLDTYRACLSMLSYAIAMRFFSGDGA